MRYITLRLNNNLAKIPILSECEKTIDEFYIKTPQTSDLEKLDNVDDKSLMVFEDFYLEDAYRTFYNLVKTIDHKYTRRELLTIANYVYHLKGSIVSVDEFCKFFGIELVMNYQDFQLDVNFTVKNAMVDDLTSFIFYMKLLLFELLFYLNADFKIIDAHFNVEIVNEIETATATKLINNIYPEV